MAATTRSSVTNLSRFLTSVLVLACGIAGAVLAHRSAADLDQLWDERIDRDIADGLRAHPLIGEQPALDASQLRLPMYVTAAVFAATGRDDLPTARAVSAAVGALTVVAAAGLGSALFGRLAGLVAAALLAFSPYFLSFARIAMTEGDVFLACTMTTALWAFVAWLRRPTSGRWLASALLLALAVGAKLYAIALVPVFWVLARSTWRANNDVHVTPGTDDPAPRQLLRLLAAGMVVTVLTALAATVSKPLAIAGWALLGLIWLATAGLFLMRRAVPRSPTWAVVALVAFAVVSFFVMMPVHLVEHRILRELVLRTLRWDHQYPLALWSDHLRLYSGIVAVKATVPLGILTFLASAYAVVRERDDGRWRPCILTTIFYAVALCFLPLRQTFYLMGVYPQLMVITAGFIVEIGRRLAGRREAADADLPTTSGRPGAMIETPVATRRWLTMGWGVGVVMALAHLGWCVGQSYPHFHLYGRALVGDRWLGAESRGYRNLIQTPSDGVETLIRWCAAHVSADETVVSYLWEDHLIDRMPPAATPFRLIRRGLSQESDRLPPQPGLRQADYVLLHINNLLGYGDRPADWPAPEDLARFAPVFTVRRAGLEVAWVYGRRDPQKH